MMQSPPAELRGAPSLTWRVHLARRQPLRAGVVVIFIAASAGAAYLIWAHLAAAAVVAFLVLSAVAEFLLPINYSIGPQGVTCRNFLSCRHLAWSEIRRCYRDADGVKLSPLARPSRLEAYRGIYLWLDHESERVLCALRHYLRRSEGD